MSEETAPDTPTETESVQCTSTPLSCDPKANVAEMFKKMGDQLGWFKYNNLETALKTLSKSSKKRSTKSRVGKVANGSDKEKESLNAHRSKENPLLEKVTEKHKLSFNSSPLQEKQIHSSNEDFIEQVLPRKSKACIDLTKEWKETKKKLKKTTRISIIPSADTENISPVFPINRDKRYSISTVEVGNPIQESTRIHSRESIDKLLDLSSSSNLSEKESSQNKSTRQSLTEEDSYRQLNIMKDGKQSHCPKEDLTNSISVMQVNRSRHEETQLYTTAPCEVLEPGPAFQTVMEGLGDDIPEEAVQTLEDLQSIPESSVESAERTDNSSYIEIEDASAQADVKEISVKCLSVSKSQKPGTDSSQNDLLQNSSDSSGIYSVHEPIVIVTDVETEEVSNRVEESTDSSYVEIEDVSLQTSAVVHSQKDFDEDTESGSSYVEVEERSFQTSFIKGSQKDDHGSKISSGKATQNLDIHYVEREGDRYFKTEQNLSSEENFIENSEKCKSKEESGSMGHTNFSSDEESFSDGLFTPVTKNVVQKAPGVTNVRITPEVEKVILDNGTEDLNEEKECIVENSSDLDDSLPDIDQRIKHTKDKVGNSASKLKTAKYVDISSDSDNDLPDVKGAGLQWDEGILSSDSDDFLSDRGFSAKKNKASSKTGQEQPSTVHWRTPKHYKSESSDVYQNHCMLIVAVFQKMKAPKKVSPKETPKKNTSLDQFIVEDDEMSSSDNDEDFYITTSNILTTPHRAHRKVEPVLLDNSEDDIFKSDIKPIIRKPRQKIQKTTSRERDLWEEKEEPKYNFLKSLSTDTPEDRCDREALRYTKNFKKMKEDLTNRLFKLYNETVFENKLPEDLLILWNNRLLKTAGYCVYKKNAKTQDSSSVRVELSTKVCDSPERVRDTLIHELCHAAVWLLHGKNDGHGPYWRIWAKKANLTHPEIPIIARCHSYSISTKYTYQCSKCGYSIGRHSKSLDTSRKVCGFCHGQFILINNRQMSQGSGSTPATPRTPNKFAMYVKENYGTMKEREKDLKHGEIMKLLGKAFTESNKIS
ncbi:germ cell nuclear acidic protein-like [Saccostrea cucullata]|uniref:germ cell nuclear acidic protein-like n=1 Tax=Saccostrea cuccullata TaxID=36930 RepID=UPI002ED5CE95